MESKNHRPIIFAHRGASGYEVENTFRSFDKAIELGADGLESDCWMLADGETILLHDKSLNLPGQETPSNISKLTLNEVKSVVFPNGQTLPTVKEFFERYQKAKSNLGVPVSFSLDLQDFKVGIEVAALTEKMELNDRVYLCANTTTGLKKVRASNPKVMLMASNIEDQLRPENITGEGKMAQLGVAGFNIQANNFKPEYLDLLRKVGLRCFIWDLHTEELLHQYIPYRPDAIYSNYPDLAARVCKEIL